MELTPDQLDAMMDEAEKRGLDPTKQKPAEFAAVLKAAGHPLFQNLAPPRAAPAPTAGGAQQGLDLPAPRGEAKHLPATAGAGEGKHLPAAHAPITTVEGLEGLGRGDVRIPKLQIRQSTTNGDGVDTVPLGSLFLSFDPSGHAPRRMIGVLDVQPGRGFLLPFGNSREAIARKAELRSRMFRERGLTVPDDAMSVCSSRDRVKPVDRGHGVVSPTCKGCPYSEWRTVDGRRTPPECGEDYRLVVLDEATDSPAVFTVRKTGIGAVKNLNTNLMIASRGKTPPAGFRLSIETVKDTDGSNTWYVPKFGPPAPLSKDPAEQAAELERRLSIRRGIVSNPAVTVDDEHGGEA